MRFRYSCLQSSTVSGVGNLNRTDPKLVRPFYKLPPNSPCIDAGDIATNPADTDYEGDPRSSVSKPLGQKIPDLGADEYVQAGSVMPYGTRGFGAFNFFPRIQSPHETARIGHAVTVELRGAIMPHFNVPTTSAHLLIGLRDDSGNLPFDPGSQRAVGSLLWTDLQSVLGPLPAAPNGDATTTIPIPNARQLVDFTFCCQWLAVQRIATPGGVVMSNGLRITIGS